jgi:DNA polymerase-4
MRAEKSLFLDTHPFERQVWHNGTTTYNQVSEFMILHIDMDAFFAAVEQRDNPELKHRPVVVCGNSPRAVVSTASYEARQFGIHSAMPLFQAKQLCPHLIVVPGHRDKYAAASQQIMAIISKFTPLVEPVSIDEAYADVTGCSTLFGPPPVIARQIKQTLYNHLALTCSIGIAPVKFLAKIASDMNKPDGLTHITREQMPKVIQTLPVHQVPGVGKQAMHRMKELNIQTLGDIQRFDVTLLNKKFGKFGQRLYQLCRGLDDDRIRPRAARKSISCETTLETDISDEQTARKILLSLAGRVGRELRKKNRVCESVSIKIKFSDFTQITRTRKTQARTCSTEAIFHQARLLFEQVKLTQKIRLLGVGVSHLQPKHAPVQMALLSLPEDNTTKQWESVDQAMDRIFEKFGREMVTPAVLNPLKNPSPGKGGPMTRTSAKKLIISGKVQGVYFRLETRKAALQAGVDGYVKNRADGSVEAVFQGPTQAVDQMVAWCHQGPPAARVDQVTVETLALQPDTNGFDIRY